MQHFERLESEDGTAVHLHEVEVTRKYLLGIFGDAIICYQKAKVFRRRIGALAPSFSQYSFFANISSSFSISLNSQEKLACPGKWKIPKNELMGFGPCSPTAICNLFFANAENNLLAIFTQSPLEHPSNKSQESNWAQKPSTPIP